MAEISSALRKFEKETERGDRIFVHTDAAQVGLYWKVYTPLSVYFICQAIGKVPVNVEQLDVDYLSVVGHKFYGPRVAALYVRGLEDKKTPFHSLLCGAGQERGYRPG